MWSVAPPAEALCHSVSIWPVVGGSALLLGSQRSHRLPEGGCFTERRALETSRVIAPYVTQFSIWYGEKTEPDFSVVL